MAIDPGIISKEEARLISLVGMAEKRTTRAIEKRDAAIVEVDAAIDGHCRAVKELDDWRASQPHQQDLPL